jgi:type VI secretion system protein VasJ
MSFDQAIQALGSNPIPGEAATGTSARYEPEFERMQAEIDKLTSLSGAAPDWQLVIAEASSVLAGKSKDLMAASYLSAGLREANGWAGLADGLNLIKTMLATFWEGVHPGKLRARKSAIDWLLDRLKVVLEPVPVNPGDRADAEACLAQIDAIVAFGEGRWENDPPTIWALGQIIKDKIATIPQAGPAAAGKPGGAPGASSGGAAHLAAAFALSPAGIPAGRAEAYRQIIAAAEFLTALEPHSPVPYLLRRAASWGGMSLPQLYVELQRTGSAWDLVLAGMPEAGAAGASAAAASSPSPAADAAPRGDF